MVIQEKPATDYTGDLLGRFIIAIMLLFVASIVKGIL